MITPSFSPTATERVLPKLALDFTTASLDSRVTFTRTTSATNPATYVNSSGIITAATNDQPRFDYNPVTLSCKGLLIEESRTNLLLQSRNLTTSWTISRASTGVGSTAPDGSASTRITCNTNSASGYLSNQTVTRSASTTYTGSVYIKKGNLNFAAVTLFDGTTNYFRQYFNVATVAVLGTASVVWTGSGSVEDCGNGWVRCKITALTTAGTSLQMIVYPAQPSEGNFNCSVDDYADVYGAQVELGAFATSYIPTTTTALTRNADVATMTGTNFTDWFNANQGSFNIVFNNEGVDRSHGSGIVSFDDSTNTAYLIYRSTNSQALVAIGGVNTSNLGTITFNTTQNAAYSYNSSNGRAALNAATTVAVTTSGITTPTLLRFGNSVSGVNYFSGWISKFNYWPQRITDNEVQAFSK